MTNLHILDNDVNPVTKALYHIKENMVNLQQLQNIPDPEPLIAGYIYRDSLVVLWSDPKVGKSFVVIDWAMSVACGRSWFGNYTVGGKVIIVAGEGVRGLKKRINAWMQHNDLVPNEEALMLVKIMPDLLDENYFQAMCQIIAEEQPALFVIDTYARAMTGHNENDNRDAGMFIQRVEELRAICGSTILLVHHSNSANTGLQKMRGATALRGALDTEIEMVQVDMDDPSSNWISMRELRCRSQKDAKPFTDTPVHFREKHGSLVVLDSRPQEMKAI